MKRDPDAHERSDAEESAPPRPPFNIFAKLPQIPLSTYASTNEPKESGTKENQRQTDNPVTKPSTTDAASIPDHSDDKQRRLLILIVVLLAGVVIGIALSW